MTNGKYKAGDIVELHLSRLFDLYRNDSIDEIPDAPVFATTYDSQDDREVDGVVLGVIDDDSEITGPIPIETWHCVNDYDGIVWHKVKLIDGTTVIAGEEYDAFKIDNMDKTTEDALRRVLVHRDLDALNFLEEKNSVVKRQSLPKYGDTLIVINPELYCQPAVVEFIGFPGFTEEPNKISQFVIKPLTGGDQDLINIRGQDRWIVLRFPG